MKTLKLLSIALLSLSIFISCKSSTKVEESDSIFPKYIDQNSNGINDYVEPETHLSGASQAVGTNYFPASTTINNHNFIDANEDGICDPAQDGSPSWHGPGYTDENGNGICDYWDEDHPMHSRHEGMRYRDENSNGMNDYMEQATHWADHDFIDENGDGICDLAQDGSPTWHGPGFVDEDGDGTCDYWQDGGRGHGGMGGHQ